MKHFIYTYSEVFKHGTTYKTARVYRIVKNQPRLTGVRTDTFVAEFQLVMDLLEHAKALPKAAFKCHENGSRMYVRDTLETAGFARVTRVV